VIFVFLCCIKFLIYIRLLFTKTGVGQQRDRAETGMVEGANRAGQNEQFGIACMGHTQGRVCADQSWPNVEGGGHGVGDPVAVQSY
jgi:hypothetical protein